MIDHQPSAARLAALRRKREPSEPSPWFLTCAMLVLITVLLCWAAPMVDEVNELRERVAAHRGCS